MQRLTQRLKIHEQVAHFFVSTGGSKIREQVAQIFIDIHTHNNYLITGAKFDEAKFDEMRESRQIAANLKASKEQLLDDLS